MANTQTVSSGQPKTHGQQNKGKTLTGQRIDEPNSQIHQTRTQPHHSHTTHTQPQLEQGTHPKHRMWLETSFQARLYE
jgi:hypothetical protein